MADHSELKKLADAAPEGPWFGPEYAPGTSYVFDVDLGTLLAYESIDSEQDACLRYVAAANPAAVLALIAEVERLRTAEGDAMTYKAGMENVAQQRDQLKAENAGLKTGYEAYEQVVQGLKAEVEVLHAGRQQSSRLIENLQAELDEAKQFQPIGEACLSNRDTLRASLGLKLGDHLHEHVELLRKDAERYRWLRDHCGIVEYKAIAGSIGSRMLPSGENLDAALSAAMGQGEQS